MENLNQKETKRIEAAEKAASERIEAAEKAASERIEAAEKAASEKVEAAEKAASERIEAAEKAASDKKYTRASAAADAIKEGGSLEELAERAAELYSKKVGKSGKRDLEEARCDLKKVVSALSRLNLIQIKEGKINLLKK